MEIDALEQLISKDVKVQGQIVLDGFRTCLTVVIASVVAVIVVAIITPILIVVARLRPTVMVISLIRSTVTVVEVLTTIAVVVAVAPGLLGGRWYSKGAI
jgi:hypothetical protein